METGRTVILLNLENLYESLYDVLNQVMICLNGIKFVFVPYDHSIILNYVRIDMLTLDCKVIALSAESMINLSMKLL